MRHFRLSRLAAAVVMLGSTLGIAGGTLLATSGPASAEAGGVNVCNTFNGVADASGAVAIASGTLSDCHQQGSGMLAGVFDITGAPAPASIAWATGHATSLINLQLIAIDFSGDGCPTPGAIAATVLLTVGGGPYEGSGSTAVICADPTTTPITVTNITPVVI